MGLVGSTYEDKQEGTWRYIIVFGLVLSQFIKDLFPFIKVLLS